MKLIFLGTGAGNGVPAFYCDCDVCREARAIPRCRRTRSAVAISGNGCNILVDAPPEISSQLMRENITRIDHLFLTHDHHDHSAGLGDIDIYATYFLRKPLPAYMSPQVRDRLAALCGTYEECLDITPLVPGQKVYFIGCSVSPLSVSHGPGVYGYLIESSGVRTAYIPDTGPLPEATRQLLQGIDTLILDATFWGKNLYPDVHLTVSDAIKTAEELDISTLYLTHLSMHYTKPVTSADLEQEIKHYNGKVRLAYDGLTVPLSRSPAVTGNEAGTNNNEEQGLLTPCRA